MARLMVFTGNANPELGNQIAKSLGVSPSNAHVGLFSDGEINIEIRENVRGHDVFIVQPICSPTNRNLMELVFMIDALTKQPMLNNLSYDIYAQVTILNSFKQQVF